MLPLSKLLKGISDGTRTRTITTTDGERIHWAVSRRGARTTAMEREHQRRMDKEDLSNPTIKRKRALIKSYTSSKKKRTAPVRRGRKRKPP